METVHKLETTMASWYERAPHLPKSGQEWLAKNVWWIALVGAIIGVLGVLGIAAALVFGTALLGMSFGIFGVAAGAALTFIVLLNVAFSIATVILVSLSVQPLKTQQKRGWELLFITMLLDAALIVLTLLAGWNFGSFLSGVIGLVIGGYFLFEIRQYFALNQRA